MTVLDWFFVCLFLAGGVIIVVLHFRAKKLKARVNELEVQIVIDKVNPPLSFKDFLGCISKDFNFLVIHAGKGNVKDLPAVYLDAVYSRFDAEIRFSSYRDLESMCRKLSSHTFSPILREYLISSGLFVKNRECIVTCIEAYYTDNVANNDNKSKMVDDLKYELKNYFSFDRFYDYVLEPVFRERFGNVRP